MAGNLKAAELRRLLAKGEFILAPGIYDGISARVADGMGFPALYMTGYGATASHARPAGCRPRDLFRHGGPRRDDLLGGRRRR